MVLFFLSCHCLGNQKAVPMLTLCTGPGADPGFFQTGGCKYESSRKTSQGKRNWRGWMGEGLELGYV